jgi:hypothetical protein
VFPGSLAALTFWIAYFTYFNVNCVTPDVFSARRLIAHCPVRRDFCWVGIAWD